MTEPTPGYYYLVGVFLLMALGIKFQRKTSLLRSQVTRQDDHEGQEVFGCFDQLSKTIVTRKDCGTRILKIRTTYGISIPRCCKRVYDTATIDINSFTFLVKVTAAVGSFDTTWMEKPI